jgi:hypothetical protein
VRTIAATFDDSAAAEDAQRQLLESSVDPNAISVAKAAVGDSDELPTYHPATIVAVLVDGNAPVVRDVLESSGGYVVADRELDDPTAAGVAETAG